MGFLKSKDELEGGLPPAGPHAATIADMNISEGAVATYASFTYTLDDGRPVGELLTIDAEPTSPKFSDVGVGVQRLEQIGEAVGFDISTAEGPEDLLKAFIGERVSLIVVHRNKNGVKVAVPKMVSALKESKPAKAKTEVATEE